MARKVTQIRYYGDNNAKNYPNELKGSQLTTGIAFKKYMPIYQIGIQAIPGAAFSINNSTESILIGTTGIYELNVDNLTQITNLTFDKITVKNVNESNGLAYIIVDILYEG